MRHLGLDLRSLALFRVSLAALTLGDLACRLGEVRAFYSDAGVLPRAAQLALAEPASVSIHLASGAPAVIAGLLVLQLLFALMALVGCRARLAAALGFVLLGSLNARNPLVLLPGDVLMVALWFWALFLPIGARWSLDAARSAPEAVPAPGPYRSWGAAGLTLQLALSLGAALFLGAGLAPAPLAVGLLALIPGRAWDLAARALDSGRRLRIYYDKDCEPCRAACELLCHFLVVPRAELLVAQEQVRIRTLMESRNSWVVVDADDVAHTKWRGFVAVLRHSLLLRGLAPLAGLSLWDRPGDALYDLVARRRRVLGVVAALPRAAGAVEPGRASRRLALVFVLVLLVHAAGRAGALPDTVARPAAQLSTLLGMGAESAAAPSRTLIVAGQTGDGPEINVLEPGAPLFEPPSEPTPPRWRSYYAQLAQPAQATRYAAYLCRRWREDHEGATPGALRMFELVSRGGSAYEQRILWRGDCPAP